jgi:hypothetical protein
MSLNDIQLKPQLISDLYSSVLIETNARAVPTTATVPKKETQVTLISWAKMKRAY